MAKLVRLLVIVSLLWCGMHFVEPIDAHAHAHVEQAGHPDDWAERVPDRHDPGAAPADPAHPGHHHCPVVPLYAGTDEPALAPCTESKPFPLPVAALRSLASPPPFEPPAA